MSHTRDRHAAYYLALIKRELDDWRAISAEFPQIQRAWETIAEITAAQCRGNTPQQSRSGL